VKAKRTPAGKSTRAKAPVRKRPAAKRAAPKKQAARRKTPPRKPSAIGAVATAVRGSVAGAVAAVRRKVSARGATDAIALLEADHRRMEELMKRGEDTTKRAVQGRRELLDKLTAELTAHELIEEQVLYPALQAHPEATDIVLEGFQEHHVADLIVKELHEVATDNEQWGAKFKVLKENIEHHIEEEEGEMFRTARAVFSQDELEAMGAQMAAKQAQAQRS
jgi:hemerythrin-like domain-containing protein